MQENFYDTLGIGKDASAKELRAAYRRLARQYHPDVNPKNTSEAESKFKEINEAYQVLSDPASRHKYDQFGDNWRQAEYITRARSSKSPFTWFNDARTTRNQSNINSFDSIDSIFSQAFNAGYSRGPASSRSVKEIDISVTLEEAYNGTTKLVETPPFSNISSNRYELKIPPGIKPGEKIKLAIGSQKNQQFLNCKIQIKAHRFFTRVGNNLKIQTEMTLLQAVLGGEIFVPVISGKKIALRIPPETPNGQVFKLKGKGMPIKSKPSEFGDQMVSVQVVLPQNITDEQRQLFEQLDQLS